MQELVIASWHQCNGCGSSFTVSLKVSLMSMSMIKVSNISLKLVIAFGNPVSDSSG